MTLIESVLFISIALGLIVGGIVFLQQASLAAKTQRQIRVLSSAFSQLATVLDHASGLSDINSTSASSLFVVARIVPEEITRDTGGPTTGSFLVSEYDTELLLTAAADGTGFTIFAVITDIPVEFCTRLVATDTRGMSTIGHLVAKAGAFDSFGQFEESGFDGLNLIAPISPSEAAAACAAADGSAGGTPDGLVTAGIGVPYTQ